MFDQRNASNNQHVTQLIPGYGYYDRLGDSLAEGLLNLVEMIFSLFDYLRR